MKFSTALRNPAARRIEDLKNADLVIGIPCYNNQATVGHVVKSVTEGVNAYYPSLRTLIMISDGGSVDDTREIVEEFETASWNNELLVTIYRGIPGKGCALRAIFEAAQFLRAKACVLFDSDLRSITPEWVKAMADPVLEKHFDFVAPHYKRYKFDGTITNNIVYNLTRSLYGKQVRQPIGGDFAMSGGFITELLPQDVWDTDVGRFGIDIWLTTNAIVRGFKVCQSRLGVKIHDVKDPTESLGPMFRQVVATIFSLMEEYETYWKYIEGSEEVETLGEEPDIHPEPFTINKEGLVETFKVGFEHFGPLWKSVLEPDNYAEIENLVRQDCKDFVVDREWWIKTLFNFAAVYHKWHKNRFKLVTSMTPLYNARIASTVTKMENLTDAEAEELILEGAQDFERLKPYLIDLWNRA